MIKVMPIDFIRQVIEQTLEEEHYKEPSKYYGGKNQVNLFSFYEQVVEDEEVNRFVEVYNDLVEQQNRTGLIMNGVIIAPENPQIMNVHIHEIIPMSFTTNFRVQLKNRDMAIATLNNLFDKLKGRKRDIAMFENGKLLVVNTVANNVLGAPIMENGSFIGSVSSLENISTSITTLLNSIKITLGLQTMDFGEYQYFEYNGALYKTIYNSTNLVWEIDETFEYHAKQFEKYKLSLSFDTLRVDEPRTLSGDDYCKISFGGSATLVSGEVELGNDLTKIGIKKKSIAAQTSISLTDNVHWLEPLEMPNNLGVAGDITQLASSNFVQGKHNNGINPTMTYSFVLDKSETLIKQWYKYARYGIQGQPSDSPTYSTGVTPNMVYEVAEIWSSWGNIEKVVFNAKSTENVELENTESDVLTIKLQLEVQP